MALFAGLARRAKILHRRWNGTRVSMEGHGHDLPQTRKLRPHKPSCSRADMAFDASYAGVGRILVRRVFRGHHSVTGSSAETGRIHVLDAAIRRRRDNEKVERGRKCDPLQSTPQ